MILNLTAAGKNLLLEALNGETVNFTEIQIGNGPAQDLSEATALVNPLLNVQISKYEIGGQYATVTGSFTNSAITSGFHITEIGLFAQDDSSGNPVLYAVGNEDESVADYVPDNTNRILEMQLDTIVFVGDTENVAAAINSSLVYATSDELKAHVSSSSNPHGVTKEQIGLGNVPNVATNDQTVTYSTPNILSMLVSGEKISTAFGKIKLAVNTLISHIGNRSNPHGVTASQAGAAAVGHTHSTTDINSGVLPVARGGTGLSAPARGGLLRGNGANTVSVVYGTGALYSPTSGNPKFGTLPVSMGGTGVTTLAGLKSLVQETPFVCGMYDGDGETTRTINLGFTPNFVMVICPCCPNNALYNGIASYGYNAVIGNYPSYTTTYNYHYTTVAITSSGFTVSYCSGSSAHAQTNRSGYKYIYIAFK